MNICDDRHEQQYKVIYKPAKGGIHTPVWLVCESCLENKRHFGSDDVIDSIEQITKITDDS